ncbi:hypothetical protein GCM10010387_20710 [Streptomyces inusitatus]|uniref:Uncharacterized protein n=1 Tax=Streptomyces inusitatus TaxID=68221 RepID=A0A918PZH4_9ACTN|nr:hypothetical protein GCM10010387_20710 [Streptomyces inusitatus]
METIEPNSFPYPRFLMLPGPPGTPAYCDDGGHCPSDGVIPPRTFRQPAAYNAWLVARWS